MTACRRLVLALPFGLAALAAMPASAQETVIVPVRVIYPGETVTADMLREAAFNNPNVSIASFAVLPQDAEGKVTRRTLLPGRMIPTASLREPYAVEAGKPVEVQYVQGALTISLTAVSLQPGAIGDMIKLRNVDSGVTFSGVILADGTVRVSAT